MTDIISIEDLAKENGITFWYAHDLSEYLEYKDFDTFKNVVKKARASADHIGGIDSDDEFISIELNGRRTFKLTRFACLLCVLHADDKKPKVSLAKVALAKFVDEVLHNYKNKIDRIDARTELSVGENEMESAAKQQGLSNDKFALFKNAGYRGMYNMSLRQLKEHKGIDVKHNLYDHMGIEELAANTFRVTQTKARLNNSTIIDEQDIIKIANSVGKMVRGVMHVKPENLKTEQKIAQIKSEVKKTHKKIIM